MIAPSTYFYTSEYNVRSNRYISCNETNLCFIDNMECDYYHSFCKCKTGYEFLNDSKTCIRCPGYKFTCDSCCFNDIPGLSCINNTCLCANPDSPFCPSQSGVFVTASQIALSAALIMGIAALSMVIYRLCTKPKYQTARQRAERRMRDRNSVDTDNYGNIRSSLSSMQIRILARLRDRPPPYHGEQTANTLSTIQTIENPPSYNCTRDLESHLPPPYTEIVLNPSGYLNQSFENTEQLATSLNVNTDNRSVTKDDAIPNENIDNNNNNKHQ